MSSLTQHVCEEYDLLVSGEPPECNLMCLSPLSDGQILSLASRFWHLATPEGDLAELLIHKVSSYPRTHHHTHHHTHTPSHTPSHTHTHHHTHTHTPSHTHTITHSPSHTHKAQGFVSDCCVYPAFRSLTTTPLGCRSCSFVSPPVRSPVYVPRARRVKAILCLWRSYALSLNGMAWSCIPARTVPP